MKTKLPKRIARASEALVNASICLKTSVAEAPYSEILSRQHYGAADCYLSDARAELATYVMEQLLADREHLQTEVFETATRLVKDWPGPLLVEHGTAELTPAWARSLKRLLRKSASPASAGNPNPL